MPNSPSSFSSHTQIPTGPAMYSSKTMPKQRQENLGMVYCINRVITQVKKTLVLVYVDIPKSLDDGAEKEIGVDGILARYKVRRW